MHVLSELAAPPGPHRRPLALDDLRRESGARRRDDLAELGVDLGRPRRREQERDKPGRLVAWRARQIAEARADSLVRACGHLAARTRRKQDEPFDEVGMAEGERERDVPTHGPPEDGGASEADFVDEARYVFGEILDREVTTVIRRFAH